MYREHPEDYPHHLQTDQLGERKVEDVVRHSGGGIRSVSSYIFFFFQAEDGIRDVAVTGVQTCALPICDLSWSCRRAPRAVFQDERPDDAADDERATRPRVPCRTPPSHGLTRSREGAGTDRKSVV